MVKMSIELLMSYLNTFEPKTYLPGDDPSNSFFGSVATTNYNGEEKVLGLQYHALSQMVRLTL